MAQEDDGQNRTEAPTQRRRDDARAEGQVANSPDLSGAVVLLAGLTALVYQAPTMARRLLQTIRFDLPAGVVPELDAHRAGEIFVGMFSTGLSLLGSYCVVTLVAGVSASALQVGVHFLPDLIGVRVERLAPRSFLSWSAAVKGLTALVKTSLVGVVAWWVLKDRSVQIFSDQPLAASIGQAWSLVARVAMMAAAALVLLGVIDHLYQRWRIEQSLRMTKQELKEEVKREEGNPQIKGRVRRMQRDIARKRMFQDVPKATVIVTNPTHLAVALRYEAGVMTAPKVLAKGAGHVAQRIIELARRHGVPVVERKPLARALFKVVKVGQEIPAALFVVVAELLAFVYRMRGR